MFKKETEYALRGLVYIQIQNRSGKNPGIIEIATEIDTPPSFTAKILQRLVQVGFIKSIKGKNGGYFFDTEEPELTLKKVVVSIEGDNIFTNCGFGLKHCDDSNPCPLHESYGPIRKAIDYLLSTETIQSMIEKDNPDVELNRYLKNT